ncbi:MAG: alpha/beta fold hydrolase [Nitrospirales bacterium]|nr:alpha/beta fold hydrolase [Nitrospirales bacterium]
MKRKLTILEKFLISDYESQFELLKDPETKATVQAWMGADAYSQFVIHGPGPDHLGVGPKNIIFAPGVMGSTLQSNGLGGVWWLDIVRARDKLNELRLTDKGQDFDNDAEIMPGAVDLSYVPFRKALATANDFGGSVHFPYDWRKSLRVSVDALRDAILKTYSEYGKRVHLIGHSMGGLMIRTALMIHGKEIWPKVDRIVFIGTPHYGSPSIAGYLKNHLWGWEQLAILGMFLNRETFRTLRGVLSLLPAPVGIYPGTRDGEDHPCANFDMYDAKAWELELDAVATVNLQNILNEVRNLYVDLHQWHNSLLQEDKDRMLMIAGVGQETLFRLEFDSAFWGFWEHTNKITGRVSCEPDRDGDGRVPLASAQLEDVTIRYVKGEHVGLPNLPSVAQDVLAWLTGNKLKLPETCQGALGGHLSGEDQLTPVPLLDGSGIGSRFRELPDYENPTSEFREKIAGELDAGRIPQINFIKIL